MALAVFLSLLLLSSFLEGKEEDNFGLELYVDSQNGKESCDGSITCPFLTLTQARDSIRQIKQTSGLPIGGIAVNLREGSYNTTSPPPSPTPSPFLLSPFSLTSLDSGEEGAPIVYRSYNEEKATVTGGYVVSPEQWVPVQGREGIWALDLVNIFGKEILGTFGDLHSGGLGTCANNKMELFYNGSPMTLARFPNIQNYVWEWTNIVDVDPNNPNAFYYDSSLDSHIQNWQKEADLWLHGYWSYDWADSYTKVLSINSTSRMILTDPNNPPVYGYKKSARYYIVNALSELDIEQEYYINRQAGILYFFPPGSSPSFPSLLSFSSDVISTQNVNWVEWRGLEIEGGRGVGLRVVGGEGIVVEDCVVGNMGDTGLTIQGANNSKVQNNEIKYSGCKGMSLSCGDVNSLTPGGCLVQNNNIHHYARWKRTYVAGLAYGGVGTVFENNQISEAPHQGISGHGNNLIFKNNFLFNLAFEVSDSGAFYSGRNWIDWNNTLTENVFQNIRTNTTIYLGSPSVQGVYFDDQLCGYTTINNTFIDCQCGILLGGGRQHLITQNTFINCSKNIHFDNRGQTWEPSYCQPGGTFNQQLDNVHYQQPPWSVSYPWLPTIFDSDNYPCTPVWNNITQNNYCPCDIGIVDQSDQTLESWHSLESNNFCNC